MSAIEDFIVGRWATEMYLDLWLVVELRAPIPSKLGLAPPSLVVGCWLCVQHLAAAVGCSMHVVCHVLLLSPLGACHSM